MKRLPNRRLLTYAAVVAVVAATGIVWFQTREIELSRTPNSNGQYVAIVSYQRWQKPFVTTPGNSSGHAGYIRIEDQGGKNFGTLNLPILWMADDIRWEDHGATLIGAGVWDFNSGTCEPWE